MAGLNQQPQPQNNIVEDNADGLVVEGNLPAEPGMIEEEEPRNIYFKLSDLWLGFDSFLYQVT